MIGIVREYGRLLTGVANARRDGFGWKIRHAREYNITPYAWRR